MSAPQPGLLTLFPGMILTGRISNWNKCKLTQAGYLPCSLQRMMLGQTELPHSLSFYLIIEYNNSSNCELIFKIAFIADRSSYGKSFVSVNNLVSRKGNGGRSLPKAIGLVSMGLRLRFLVYWFCIWV